MKKIKKYKKPIIGISIDTGTKKTSSIFSKIKSLASKKTK